MRESATNTLSVDQSPLLPRIVDAGFAALLMVCGVRYFSVHEFDHRGVLVLTLAACAATAYAAAVLVSPSARRSRIGILTATGLWFPLVLLAPSFGWAAFALFFAVHRVLPRRSAQCVAAAIVIAVSLGLYLLSRGQDLGLVLGPLVGGIVLFIVYAQLNRALEQRNELISELIEAQSQLTQREREAGALTERTRVATELHDTVVQQTASALLLLESFEAPSESARSAAQLPEAREVLRASLSGTRQLMHGLTAPRGPQRSLSQELQRICALHGATFSRVGDERPLSSDREHAVLRVAQEALVNVGKHAQARHTRVTLTFFDDAVALDVADNGVGFRTTDADTARSAATDTRGATAADAARGYGLRAMAWRIENLGGTFTLETTPGGGTVISGYLPLSHTPKAHG